ncbi:pyrroloquinoline quinone biosynthesis peptide chaperone PqqD [Limnobacter sp.]|uniref:pyrroloquinoline quinone biosynthesis peptide chaperone PqqD n=1 Tax=Limnobacter sp. TaxID=2003368 RepID=UPI00259106A8|nr:pyrroloquinoline quinone biosynthesis peptide chaperone PqqD [Limnobacter sp.]
MNDTSNTITVPERPRLNRLFKMQYEEAQQSYVLLYPEGMVKLNQSASEILLLCDGTRTLNEIVHTLETRFSTNNLGPDVTAMLEEACRRNWLEAA